jgi:uncharacterized protein
MTGWILRIVLLILVVRMLWRLLSGIVEGAAGLPAGRRRDTAVPLVRDPVCGTYVVRSRALTAGSGASLQYFCSERCRAEYRKAR